jgi:hypothetical protein
MHIHKYKLILESSVKSMQVNGYQSKETPDAYYNALTQVVAFEP